jgi:WD40 repeat protein
VIVWDLATQQVLVELKGQKYGIQAIAFSPNHKYLVSVGFQHDASLLLWDWRASVVMAVHRLSAKVFADAPGPC